MLNLDVINILVGTVAVINTLYGLVVYSRNRADSTNQSFFFLTLCVSSWGISMFVMRGFFDAQLATWGARFLYATAASIPFASLYFAKIFPLGHTRLSLSQKYLIPIPFLIALLVSLLPHSGLIDNVTLSHTKEPFIHFNFIVHTLYSLYIVGYFLWVYVILFKKLFKFSGILKLQVGYILIGTMITTWVAVFTNLFLPYIGIFYLNWVGQVGILAMITSIMYAILKHHLFNIKIIATEFLVFTLCLVLFVQIFTTQGLQEQLISVAVFTAAVSIGLLLVRSVIREVQSREEIQELYKQLEIKNQKLTELDRLKSQFLSIATHELRTPLTIVRNFVSLLLDGSYGKLAPSTEEAGKQVFDRVNDMTRSVDNYLNVSRIEQGKMKYDFVDADLTKLIEESVEGLKPNAAKKGLELNFSIDPNALNLKAKVDVSKINEVVNNLIDNSIKYTPKGTVNVRLEKVGTKARFTIKDTGVGMSQKTMAGLFKLFSPGEDSKKINPASTGVGLYVTKGHIEAHKGTIVAASEGEGKGSQFVVELPILL